MRLGIVNIATKLEPVARFEGEPSYVEKVAAAAMHIAAFAVYQLTRLSQQQPRYGVVLAVFSPGNGVVEIHAEREWADVARRRFEQGREELPKGKLSLTILRNV